METQERKAWLAARRQGLGGSDIAAILGENPFQTALDVYLSKIGEVPELEGAAIKRGRKLEPVARELYEELTGRVVDKAPAGMMIDRNHPELFANIDGAIKRDTADGVLEIKAPGLRAFAKMKAHGVPKYYLIQVQHYLGVTGMDFGAYAAFSAERWEMLHIDIERDDTLIRIMRERAVAWWHAHVVKRVPPEEEKINIPVDAAVTPGEVTIIDTPQFRDAVARFFDARGLFDMAEELVKSTKAELLEMMGMHLIVEGGGARFIHTHAAGRRTFDQKGLAAVQPLDPKKVRAAIDAWGNDPLSGKMVDDLIDGCILNLDQFYKVGAPSQPFRPYLLKKGVDTDGE